MNITTYVKSSIRHIAASTYHATSHPLTRLKGKVVVLMYHRVLSEKDIAQQVVEPGMYVERDVFEMHVKYLKEHFHILQFADLLDLWREEALDKDQRYCVITFDDGWLDNYLHAFPILTRFNIPATIFLPTDFIGTSRWFWPDKISFLLNQYFNARLEQGKKEILDRFLWITDAAGKTSIEKSASVIQSLKKLSDKEINYFIGIIAKELNLKIPNERVILNWAEIAEMSQYGISFGSHSSSHKILTGLNIEEVSMEAKKSLQVLKDKAINHVPVFCYPNGAYNEEIAERIKGAGFNAAISTAFGVEGGVPSDMFGIKRIGIHNDISFTEPLFSMRISGLDRFRL